jgi:hypothetical protein
MNQAVAQSLISMARSGHCAEASCGQAAVTSLEAEEFCISHFIKQCYQRLDQYDRQPLEVRLRNGHHDSLKHFLIECSNKTVDICLGKQDLDNLQRARLFDILLRTHEIASQGNGYCQ